MPPRVQEAPIPFPDGEAAGLDALSGAPPRLVNFIPDAANALRQRPGITDWTDFEDVEASGSPVIGMYEWRGNLLYVCEDRTIYALTAPGSVSTLGTLGGTGRPIFTYDQQRVVVTGGAAPMKWEGVGAASELAPGATDPSGAPLALTHIAYSAQRFIGNVNSNAGYLQWTAPGPGSHASWPIVGPFYSEAEAAPDPVVALFANTNEVFAFGTETTQVYSPDPAIAFSVAASLQVGCAAAYSVIETESGEFAWLDNQRRFVLSSGRGTDILSSPAMAATIKALAYVDDCWGANMMLGSHDLLVWVFHVERRCFWFDRVTSKWGEFASTDDNGEFQSWIARSYYYWNERNTHLVGLEDGRIAELTFAATADDDRAISAVSETGFIDRGTFTRKLCNRVQLQLRRGATTPPAVAPVCELRYRDNLGNWKAARRVSMGAGQYNTVMDAWTLGDYRTRQWQLRYSGGGAFTLAGAVESFEMGDS